MFRFLHLDITLLMVRNNFMIFTGLTYMHMHAASHDRTARVWATAHIAPLRILAGHLADVTCVRFHPNINYVATGSADKSLRLWEVHTGKCVRIFTGHHATINSLSFSPDGRLLASAGDDKYALITLLRHKLIRAQNDTYMGSGNFTTISAIHRTHQSCAFTRLQR